MFGMMQGWILDTKSFVLEMVVENANAFENVVPWRLGMCWYTCQSFLFRSALVLPSGVHWIFEPFSPVSLLLLVVGTKSFPLLQEMHAQTGADVLYVIHDNGLVRR